MTTPAEPSVAITGPGLTESANAAMVSHTPKRKLIQLNDFMGSLQQWRVHFGCQPVGDGRPHQLSAFAPARHASTAHSGTIVANSRGLAHRLPTWSDPVKKGATVSVGFVDADFRL